MNEKVEVIVGLANELGTKIQDLLGTEGEARIHAWANTLGRKLSEPEAEQLKSALTESGIEFVDKEDYSFYRKVELKLGEKFGVTVSYTGGLEAEKRKLEEELARLNKRILMEVQSHE